MGSDTEKSVVMLGGNCGAVGHQSEVARRWPGGGQVPVLNQCQAVAPAPGWDRCGAAALLLINLCKITTVSGKRSTTSRTFRARSCGEGCSALTLQDCRAGGCRPPYHGAISPVTAAVVSDAADGWVRGTELYLKNAFLQYNLLKLVLSTPCH